MYLIEFRSTDRTGNVEATKSVTFTIAVADNCLTNFNDEFGGHGAGCEVDRAAAAAGGRCPSSTARCGSRSATAT